MSDIICFGELMIRLSPPNYLRFEQSDTFEITFGGAEANVAVDLAFLGKNAAFVSKFPNNPMGIKARNKLRGYGVNTEHIVFGGERLGIYYQEKGASQRPSKVVYDRKHSAIAEAQPAEFDWARIFKGARWFHFTGITPSLSGNAASAVREACVKAKEGGLKVSCDLNYRKNLWTTEQAAATMGPLMKYVDLCIANEEDAESVFGISAADTDVKTGKLNQNGYIDVARKLTETFGFSEVAITLRESLSANDNIWGAMLYAGGKSYFSKKYNVHIVDRVGGGDSFAAGLIYSMLEGQAPGDAVEFAAAASCLKHSVEGDFSHISAGEVKTLVAGDSSGRVQR